MPAVAPRELTVETPLWKATISNKGGVVTSWILKQLPNGRPLKGADYSDLRLVSPFAIKQSPTDKDVELGATLGLTFPADPTLDAVANNGVYEFDTPETMLMLKDGENRDLTLTLIDPSGLTVRKKFSFHATAKDGTGYTFDFSVDARRGEAPLAAATVLGPNFGDQGVKTFDTYTNTPPEAVVNTNKPHYYAAASVKPEKPESFAGASWAAISDHYFALAVIPSQTSPNINLVNRKVQQTVNGKAGERDYLAAHVTLPNATPSTFYIGPKDPDYLDVVEKKLGGKVDLGALVNYGFFSFLVRPLIPVLDWGMSISYRFTHNFGWAIVAVTALVNTLLFPLRWKSSQSFKRSAKVQPRINELNAQLKSLKKDDPRVQEIQLEMAKLMKDGLPIMGCLPLLAQLPIFWAFFLYLQLAIDIRQAPFIGWLKDLSAPDHWHLLPILMCVTQIVTSLLMPAPQTDDPAMKMNRTLMIWVFPIVLTWFFFWTAPSGLVLYWMAGNIIGISQQLLINKLNPPDTPAVAEPAKQEKSGGKKKADVTLAPSK